MKRTFTLGSTVCVLLLFCIVSAEAQGFYPREWWQGRSGLFARDYITPSEDEPGYLFAYSDRARSSRSGRLVFAAASVDQYCQQDGSPKITVLDAPRGSRVSTDIGRFVAMSNDGGSRLCIGHSVRGTLVYYRGPARPGDHVVLRVAYPTKGLTYDHAIPVR